MDDYDDMLRDLYMERFSKSKWWETPPKETSTDSEIETARRRKVLDTWSQPRRKGVA